MKIGNFNETIGKFILNKAIQQQENMHDSCFLVGGMEGSGKSDFILQCIDYVDKERQQETPIENIAYTLTDFFLSLKVSKPCDVVALDEGKELMAMNYGDKKLKDAINIFTVIRKKRLISFIAFTNPTKVTQYFREDRIRGVFLLKKRKKNYSVIHYYTKNEFLRILSILRLQKNLNIASILKHPPLLVCYKKGAYEGRLKKAYENAKDDNIEKQLDNLVEKYKLKSDKKYSFAETCKVVSCSHSTLQKIIPLDFREKYRDSFGNIKFDESAINEIKNMVSIHVLTTNNTKFKVKAGKYGVNGVVSIH